MIVCRAGRHRFSLRVAAVREVCTNLSPVRVPGAAAPVEGVANIRGTLVTVVRADGLLEDTAPLESPSPWLVVLAGHEGRVGLGVDEVEDPGTLVGPDVRLLDPERELAKIFGR